MKVQRRYPSTDSAREMEYYLREIRDQVIAADGVAVRFYTPQMFGAVGNGVVDDTEAIQTAITKACSDGIPVYLPAGDYIISDQLTITAETEGFTMIGEGMNNTIIRTNVTGPGAAFAGGNMLRGNDQRRVVLKNFTMYGPSIDGATGAGIYLALVLWDNTEGCVFENIVIDGVAGDGFAVAIPILCTFQNVKCVRCAEHGFNVFSGTSCNFYECYGITCVKAAFRNYIMTYMAYVGCAAEVSGVGYEFELSRNVAMMGCGAEQILYRNATYPGVAYRFTNGKCNTLVSCYSTEFALVDPGYDAGHLLIDNEVDDTVISFRGTTYSTTADFTYKLVNGAQAELKNCNFDDNNGSAPATGTSTIKLDDGRLVVFGTAAPVGGTWTTGDRCINTAPAVAGAGGSQYVIEGWVYITSAWVEQRTLTGT